MLRQSNRNHVRVLIIGGTGQISTALTRHLATMGYHVTLFNRGERKVKLPPGVNNVRGDRNEHGILTTLANQHFDVVFDFICWNPNDAQADVEAFTGRCGHFFFISSVWVYGPASNFPTPEGHPRQPLEAYGQQKNAAEKVFWRACEDSNFPITVIRFHATYDDNAGWSGILAGDKTVLYRMTQGKPVLLHDRGTHLTHFLHSADAAQALCGLMEAPAASLYEAFNIVGEAVTWRDYYLRLAHTFSLSPKFVSVPAELLIRWAETHAWPLMGVHQFNMHFDTHKLFRALPNLNWMIPLEEGFQRHHTALQAKGEFNSSIDPDPAMTAFIDRLIAHWMYLSNQPFEGSQGTRRDPGWQRWLGLESS